MMLIMPIAYAPGSYHTGRESSVSVLSPLFSVLNFASLDARGTRAFRLITHHSLLITLYALR